MNDKLERLQKIIDAQIDAKKVFGSSFSIQHKGELFHVASGNLSSTSPYFIASTTKLFVTVVILKLKIFGKVQLSDKLTHFFDDALLSNLHTYKGIDYSKSITIEQLLAHTSGLPDYFQHKNKEGRSLEQDLQQRNDQYWTFEDAINRSKTIPCLFAPGTPNKASYSDTNFQLLGKIIEKVTGNQLEHVFQEMIFGPLDMNATYLYTDIQDKTPLHLYYKDQPLEIPKAMTSFWGDGGVVSTSPEMLTFIHAFFNGVLFPQNELSALYQWNRIFFPMRSGVGLHLFKLPWIFNPFGTVPPLYGHSGLSGALAYANPEKQLYIAGTVNQVAYPETSFKLAIKLINKVLH